ncbi:MAG: hypothetical protein GXX84_18410 [Acidobacteria bacterium]|nr:hypothetical protein [Acidobacteriota bacterium]
MKIRIACCLVVALVVTSFTPKPSPAANDAKITVLNPRGILPPIQRIPMAERLNSLEGKTIYIIDTKFARTRDFVETLHEVLQEKFPKTTWILRDKRGNYQVDDPDLWKEIKAKGHGVIMGIGH